MADGLAWESGPLGRGVFSGAPGLKERLRAYERELIMEALREAGGNQRRAATALGCLPTTLNEKMRRLGLRERDVANRSDTPPGESSDDPLY